MDLAEAAGQLYGGSPDDFVARRGALVKEARAAKDRALATAIGTLRRPTRSAWLVNLLARGATADLAALLELGTALREAQQRLDGAELRQLSSQRAKAVNALARRAAELGAEHGHVASEASRQEVSQTLQAALADRELAELVRMGVVAQSVVYGGFGPVDLTGVAPGPSLVPVSLPDDHEPADPESDDQAEEPDPRREQAIAEAEEGLAQAEQELADAQADAEQATADADALADRVEDLRTQLRETEAQEREAHERARFARKRTGQLSQAATRARANLDAVRNG